MKPVVGSWYWLGTGEKHPQIPCIMVPHRLDNGQIGSRMLGHIWKDGKKYYYGKEIETLANTGLKQVIGCGFGTTLIHKDLLANRKFEAINREDYHKHSDTVFYHQLWEESIPVYVDTDFVVPHYPSDWDTVKDRY
jgi:hypothetical protein